MILTIIGQIALFLGLCYILNWLRGKFPVVDTYWKNGVVWLFLAVILIHIGIWWKWPEFWGEWWSKSGFLFFQILLGVGLYLWFDLAKDKKFLKYFGILLVALGSIGVGWNVFSALRTNYSVAEVMTPSELTNLPPQNKEVEETVTKFWKKHLSEQSALSMLRVVRRQSGFNHFAKDGKSPYRNPTFDYKKAGVMQINDALWREKAYELGEAYNLYTLDGNLRFALWLYNEQGFAPWLDSNSNGGGQITSVLPTLPPLKNIVAANLSRLPGGEERPEENAVARAWLVKSLQEKLQDDTDGQQALTRIASEASRFNHFGFDGKTVLRRKVNGRAKVGLMGVDEQMWNEVGNGFPIDGSDEQNLGVALYLYKTYRQLAWTHADKVHRNSLVIDAPVERPTKYVRLSRSPHWFPSGLVSIQPEGSARVYQDGPNQVVSLPSGTKSIGFSSRSGKTEIVLFNN